MKLKVFYKGYFRHNKGCFSEILTKIKSISTSIFLVFLLDPDLQIHDMIDDGIKGVQQILSPMNHKSI